MVSVWGGGLVKRRRCAGRAAAFGMGLRGAVSA